jgi:hypothetical protein
MTSSMNHVDVDVEETDRGWRWVYQSSNGACFVSPRSDYTNKGAARRAGRAWVAANYPAP